MFIVAKKNGVVNFFINRPGAVFTEAKSGINDPELFQRRQFCPDFRGCPDQMISMKKLALSLAAMEGMLMIPANNVRLL